MVKRKFNINIFDTVVAISIILVACIFVFSINSKPNLGDSTVFVEVKVSNMESINNILKKIDIAKQVFYSGTKQPVAQESYRLERNSDGEIEKIVIVLMGPGDIKQGDSIFNGQRIYLNQKAEIRSDYFVQGYIADYYEK